MSQSYPSCYKYHFSTAFYNVVIPQIMKAVTELVRHIAMTNSYTTNVLFT
jgi:hypothetical protein